jgi:hypothetical protein
MLTEEFFLRNNIAQILGLSKREPKQNSLSQNLPGNPAKKSNNSNLMQFAVPCDFAGQNSTHDWWYKSNPTAPESRQTKTLRLRGSADSSSSFRAGP